ncbi:MAG: SMUG2 DNA glycosylase family protein [Chitinophagaceae bacterium]
MRVVKTFADRIIEFNSKLSFTGRLPDDIQVMNPFQSNAEILPVSGAFYKKYYNDNRKRVPILGINPGRLGAGATGIPFTDTKRLSEVCGLEIESVSNHEPSSVFVYELIDRYGGVEDFYGRFYINSICPLGFIERNKKGNWINCNYYDYPELVEAMKPFIIQSLKAQISLGLSTEICFALGKKNAGYLSKINEEEKLFEAIVPLEHPRYIQQYKSKEKEDYLLKFLKELKQ